MEQGTKPSILAGLKFAFRTDMANKRITPKDACLLLLASGPQTRMQLRTALWAWRPTNPDRTYRPSERLFYTYLFNSSYHHVADDFDGRITAYSWVGMKLSTYTATRAFWYRTKRGSYAITAIGLKRLTQLGFKELS